MKPKPFSKNKVKRFTVRIDYRLDRDWLIAFAAYTRISSGRFPPREKRAFWENVQIDLKECGRDIFYDWAIDIEDRRAERTKNRAGKFIDALFPELRTE